jgi:hypothetical protein
MSRDSLAVIYGLLAFLMLHVGYLYADAAIENAFMAMMWLFFATPVLAGSITGYFAQRRPLLCLLALGAAIAVSVSLVHAYRVGLGIRSPAGGLGGTVALGVFSLVFQLPMALIGGAVGAYVARTRR